MLPGAPDAALLAISLALPFSLVFFFMGPYNRLLVRRGLLVEDAHKQSGPKVPSPAGPLLVAGLIAGELVVFFFTRNVVTLAIAGSTAVAFVVGLADDLFVLGGKTKPFLLLFASIPLLLPFLFGQHIYIAKLAFPLLGATGEHFTIYTILVVAAVPVVSNAFNMMDSFNGEISGFSFLTSVALAVGILLKSYSVSSYSSVHLESILPMVGVSLAFYFYNKYPARSFDGDSGSLALGASFAALAVTSGVEIAAVVAIIPAILNSFYILSSVRGFVERRRMNARPTVMTQDGKLQASENNSAPVTLVRMILLERPMTEKELVRSILFITLVSCALSLATSYLTWVL